MPRCSSLGADLAVDGNLKLVKSYGRCQRSTKLVGFETAPPRPFKLVAKNKCCGAGKGYKDLGKGVSAAECAAATQKAGVIYFLHAAKGGICYGIMKGEVTCAMISLARASEP